MRFLSILKYFALSIALFYFLISFFPKLSSWAFKNGIYPDDYRYGDLYRLSNLPNFKEKIEPCEPEFKDGSKKNGLNLFIIGDSFTDPSKVNSNDFIAQNYTHLHWNNLKKLNIDTAQYNVLILETVERGLNYHFKTFGNQHLISPSLQTPPNTILSSVNSIIENFESNSKKVEQMLWLTLFDYDFITKIKEIKAQINLKFFDRKPDSYVLSPDKSQIFYYEEADSKTEYSSFYPTPDAQIDSFVHHINQYETDFKKQGFDEVILAIIPNKVTVLQPKMGNYNNNMKRVLNHKGLKVQYLDITDDFLAAKDSVFYKTDTHWNCYGKAIWVKKINQMLAEFDVKKERYTL